MDGKSVKDALRELFEAQVLNHGDYNSVYAQPCGPGPALVLGYHRTPLELVLCPVDVGHLTDRSGDGHRGTARLVGRISSIDLTNVATVSDTGTGYQVQTVTGFRTGFEVDGAPRITVGAVAAASGGGTVLVEQGQEAEEFHQFMGHFMDILDAFYEVPGVTEILQDAYAFPLAS